MRHIAEFMVIDDMAAKAEAKVKTDRQDFIATATHVAFDNRAAIAWYLAAVAFDGMSAEDAIAGMMDSIKHAARGMAKDGYIKASMSRGAELSCRQARLHDAQVANIK